MEEYDELSAGPNALGALDLSHSAWTSLPDTLFGFGPLLLSLNLSHNKLSSLQDEFGSLVILSKLDLGNNVIEKCSSEIGKCIRLRNLDLSFNRLDEIPSSIGCCILLEVINFKSNFLVTLPSEMGNIIALRILEVQDNKLEYIPSTIAGIPTLEEIHCSGNDKLEMVPPDMRESSDMVLWSLRLHLSQATSINDKMAIHDKWEGKAREAEENRLRTRDDLEELKGQIQELTEERPWRYIALKGKATGLLQQAGKKCVIS